MGLPEKSWKPREGAAQFQCQHFKQPPQLVQNISQDFPNFCTKGPESAGGTCRIGPTKVELPDRPAAEWREAWRNTSSATWLESVVAVDSISDKLKQHCDNWVSTSYIIWIACCCFECLKAMRAKFGGWKPRNYMFFWQTPFDKTLIADRVTWFQSLKGHAIQTLKQL